MPPFFSNLNIQVSWEQVTEKLDTPPPKYNEFKGPHLFRMHDSRIPLVGPTTHYHHQEMVNMNKEIIKITVHLIIVDIFNYILDIVNLYGLLLCWRANY